MKQANHISSSLTSAVITFLLMISNYQTVYAHVKGDVLHLNEDLNHLLSETKLIKEIEAYKVSNLNSPELKQSSNHINQALKVKSSDIPSLEINQHNFKYNPDLVYQSSIRPSRTRISNTLKLALNYVNSVYLMSSYNNKKSVINEKYNNKLALTSPRQNNYWNTLHFIESSSGKKLYRKRNKAKSCKWTTTPCGHHQLSVKALKDIGCKSLKCRSARENYGQSLSMSKQLEEINVERMKKKGYKTLPDYQRYLVHQQGAAGLGRILDALKGKKTLSKTSLQYMANNSPYSYKNLKNSGSRGAARKFLNHWEEKWRVNHGQRVVSR